MALGCHHHAAAERGNLATGAGHLCPTAAQGRCDRTCVRKGHRGAASKVGALLCTGSGSGDAARATGGGAKGLGLSLLKLGQGVSFGSEEFDPVDIVIMLAAPDKHSHIETISALAELFSSDEDMNKLHQATNLEEIKTIIARF